MTAAFEVHILQLRPTSRELLLFNFTFEEDDCVFIGILGKNCNLLCTQLLSFRPDVYGIHVQKGFDLKPESSSLSIFEQPKYSQLEKFQEAIETQWCSDFTGLVSQFFCYCHHGPTNQKRGVKVFSRAKNISLLGGYYISLRILLPGEKGSHGMEWTFQSGFKLCLVGSLAHFTGGGC